MEIIQSNDAIYLQEITELYTEVFSTGISQQHISNHELSVYINTILKNGYALLALDNNRIIGTLLCCPLTLDELFPKQTMQNISIEKCVYVAEIMISSAYRGQGIGKDLLKQFEQSADKSLYTDAVIRVWDENIPALSLYRKMGFEPIASIQQTKQRPDRKETFVMNKIYLHKKLD
jgi:diamine N-acetyltransferase